MTHAPSIGRLLTGQARPDATPAPRAPADPNLIVADLLYCWDDGDMAGVRDGGRALLAWLDAGGMPPHRMTADEARDLASRALRSDGSVP